MPEALVRRGTYDYPALRPVIFEMMAALEQGRIKENRRVLIKPNFLSPATPAKAVTTHPLVLKGVVEYVLDKKARPVISDSPAIGSFDRVLKEGGYREALRDLDVALQPFSVSVKTDIGRPFGAVELAEAALKADVVVNCAKLKTHSQMLLTLGVKNMFGCVIGLKKSEWHLRSGVDRETFARLLVQIHNRIAPAVTLIDGILALEGHGPGKGGTPKPLGILVGSREALWADAAVCRLSGLSPDRLPTLAAARRLDLSFVPVRLLGDDIGKISLKLPELAPLSFGPRRFQGLMRRHLVQRPVVDPVRCRQCGECVAICPAKAVTLDETAVSFDYDPCIRCYCCIEICPHGALHASETRPGKLLRRVMKRF